MMGSKWGSCAPLSSWDSSSRGSSAGRLVLSENAEGAVVTEPAAPPLLIPEKLKPPVAGVDDSVFPKVKPVGVD